MKQDTRAIIVREAEENVGESMEAMDRILIGKDQE